MSAHFPRRPVEIDWSRSIAKDLGHVWLGNVAEDRLFDIARGSHSNRDSYSYSPSKLGRAKRVDGTTGNEIAAADYALAGDVGECTHAIWYQIAEDGVHTDTYRVMSHDAFGGGSTDRLELGMATNGALGYFHRDGPLVWYYSLFPITWDQMTLAVLHNTGTATNLWLNGRLARSTAGFAVTNLGDVSFSRRFSSGYAVQYEFLSCMCWTRSLSDAEVWSLWDPVSRWDILREKQAVSFHLPGSAAAPTFVPYPNPRYAMAGGHQTLAGGVQ